MLNIETVEAPEGLAFPVAEYRERLKRVRERMAAADLPVLVLHLPDSLAYLSGLDLGHSGYFAYFALVVPADGDPVLVYRKFETPSVTATSWVPRFAYSDEDAEPIDATRRVLEDLGLANGRVGVDFHSWTLPADRYLTLRRLLPQAELVQEPRITEMVKLIKSEREVEYIRAAAKAADAGTLAGVNAVHVGVNELEIAAAISSAQALAGSTDLLVGVVGSGEHAVWPHSAWADRIVQEGDVVKFELHGAVRHYWARLMRSVVAGSLSDEQKRTADVLRIAQDDAFSMMKPGASAGEIDAACRLPVERAGILPLYQNRTGYGLGVHFRPMAGDYTREFMRDADWQLESGMVFHMLTQAHGIGFSETVLVTDSGIEILNDVSRELFVR